MSKLKESYLSTETGSSYLLMFFILNFGHGFFLCYNHPAEGAVAPRTLTTSHMAGPSLRELFFPSALTLMAKWPYEGHSGAPVYMRDSSLAKIIRLC